MKKIICGILIFMSLATFIPAARASDEDVTEESVYITILAADQAQSEIIDRYARDYMRETEGVEFDVSYIKDETYDAYLDALEGALDEKRAPTIFPLNINDFQRFQGKLAPMDYSTASIYAVYSTMFPVTVDEQMYGIPIGLTGTGIIYNQSIFGKTELDPELIIGFSDLEEAAAELDMLKDSIGIDAVFAIEDDALAELGMILGELYISAEFGESYETAREAALFEFIYSEEFKNYADLILKYRTGAEDAFANGKAALTVGSNDYFDNKNTAVAEMAGVIPFESAYADVVLVEATSYWAMSGSATEDEQTEAINFLDWLYYDVAEAFFAEQSIIPPYTSLTVDLPPLEAAIYARADYDETAVIMSPACPEGFVEKYFGDNFIEYANGNITFDAFADMAREGWAR